LPYVLFTVLGHPADTPARHVHRALQLLEELEDDLRVPAASILARHDHLGLVVAARRRLWLAAAALESPPHSRPSRLVRKGVSMGRGMLGVAVLVIRGAAFLLRLAWRCLRCVRRLVFVLRAI
jgi:hypothetical protein